MLWAGRQFSEALSRIAREQYVVSADEAFTSGNVLTQRLDVLRLPLAESRTLTASDGSPLMLAGIDRIGGPSVVGR